MLISFVIPSYNSSSTVKRALGPIFGAILPDNWLVEAIVVDDGSSDSEALGVILNSYKDVRLLSHSKNLGMCAGRNTGIAESRGEIVIILDADDELELEWPVTLAAIIKEWPENCFLCWAACRNPRGIVTAQDPNYVGLLTLTDLINERYSGEYLPIFRGDYVRDKQYIDLGMSKSCGILSYINFAQDAPFWISNRIMRIYHDVRIGSVSDNWNSQKKSCETVQCYLELIARYGHLYQREAPKLWRTKQLRLAAYLCFSKMPGAWIWWWKGISFYCLKESVGVFLILLLGSHFGGWLAKVGKRIGLIRRYG